MPVALPALDLAVWVAALIALALVLAARLLIEPIFHALEGPLGGIPFLGGWVTGAMNKVLEGLDAAVVALRDAASTLWQGFLWAMRETVAVTEEAFGYVESAFTQLTTVAIGGALYNLYQDVKSLVAGVESEVTTLAGTVKQDVHDLRTYADNAAGSALTTAEGYTDTWIGKTRTWAEGKIADAVSSVEKDIGIAKATAIATAEGYADTLRKAIEAELATAISGVESDLGKAVSNLTTAIATARSAVEGELTTAATTIEAQLVTDVNALDTLVATAQTTLQNAITAAEQTASTALNTAVAGLSSAIADVRSEVASIAGEIETAGSGAIAELGAIYGLDADAIRKLLDTLDLSKLVDFGAALVLVRALVETIAAEAGLDRAECRSKVKGICGVDPLAWSNLLAGLAAVGIGFTIADLVQEVVGFLPDVRGLVDELTVGAIEQAPTIGGIIGAAANAVARAA